MPAVVKIYRYLAANWALKTLQERRLKISRIKELNDPFKWWVGAFADDPNHREAGRAAFNTFVDRLNDRFGIISHSAELSDPVIWSHYADGHKGIVIEFDHYLVESLHPVSYCHVLPTIDVAHLIGSSFDPAYTSSILKTALARKSPSWAYEKEYRVHFDLTSDCQEMDEMFFSAIPEDFLKRVILGVRCQTSEEEVEDALRQGGFTDVEVVRAHLSETSFEILCD